MRRWDTNFTLSPDGGRRFCHLYGRQHPGTKLSVVLDKQIVSVATIEARIEDQGRITNLSTQQEAMQLAQFLKSGSLPAGIRYNEERSIGPSLGADSIHAGIVAGLAGLAAVILVMLGVLQEVWRERGACAGAQYGCAAGRYFLFPRGADAARHRRRDSHDRYGGGFQRPDFSSASGRNCGPASR